MCRSDRAAISPGSASVIVKKQRLFNKSWTTSITLHFTYCAGFHVASAGPAGRGGSRRCPYCKSCRAINPVSNCTQIQERLLVSRLCHTVHKRCVIMSRQVIYMIFTFHIFTRHDAEVLLWTVAESGEFRQLVRSCVAWMIEGVVWGTPGDLFNQTSKS